MERVPAARRHVRFTPMAKVILRFYEELNEYLPPDKHKRDFVACFDGPISVGELIERQRIPGDEVDLVLVNGQSVAFDHILHDGDRVSVYPVFERFDVGSVTMVRRRPLRNLRFVADKTLAQTVERLKCMGFDVYWTDDLDVEKAMDISTKEERILLTTKADIARSGNVIRSLYVGSGTVEEQIWKILEDLFMTS